MHFKARLNNYTLTYESPLKFFVQIVCKGRVNMSGLTSLEQVSEVNDVVLTLPYHLRKGGLLKTNNIIIE